jgi:hypothetical protein
VDLKGNLNIFEKVGEKEFRSQKSGVRMKKRKAETKLLTTDGY